MSVEVPGPSPPQMERLLPMTMELRRQSVKVVSRETRRRKLKGPLRAIRLFVLSILLPGLFVAVPLYMRYHVYGDQMYPVGMSDMRLLDGRVSTTWCQRQLVKANTEFNAFLLAEQPRVEPEPVHLTMTRHLVLEDDMKEYWAFYLLRGSSITVSTCVRWPGASLIVIRGHKHLHECAYIGDDSSEELEEAAAAAQNTGQWPHENASDARSNEPETMRRARPGIVFHGDQDPLASGEQLAHDSSEEDAEVMLGQFMGKMLHTRSKPEVARGPTHRQRQDEDKNGREESARESVEKSTESNVNHYANTNHSENVGNASVSKSNPSEEAAVKNTSDTTAPSNSTGPTSTEVFDEVLKKLQVLGPRGKGVLRRLNRKLGVEGSQDDGLNALRHAVRELLLEQQQEEPLPPPHRVRHGARQDTTRIRRHITLAGNLPDALTRNDEEDDAAYEEELEPDGIADHHVTLNETTSGDFSNSEFWSSFSSSEEALLNCAGLVLNLPLTPHHRCLAHHHPKDLADAAVANTLTYKVPSNGYYFFVFNSENEVQSNFIRAHFVLEKLVYNVSHPVAECLNSTESCALPLHFFSSEKVVLELPVSSNDSLWNEEFVVVSTCEPRTALYLTCVIAVPLFILLFSFQ